MKTCDFCGAQGYGHTEIFEHLRTREVKTLCSDCAEIVNDYACKLASVADRLSVKATRALRRRLHKKQQEEFESNSRWLLTHIRAWFQKDLLDKSFKIGVKADAFPAGGIDATLELQHLAQERELLRG